MRTATVVAREKTVLGVLDYGDYQAILGKEFTVFDQQFFRTIFSKQKQSQNRHVVENKHFCPLVIS